MFPIGIRIWDQNRMVYPVKFSVYLDTGKNISFIKTTVEGKRYQTFNYMMLAPAMAINGYIYEKDIVMVDGEGQKTGVVVYDKAEGKLVINTKSGKIAVNSSLEFCEILGNVYEDPDLLKEMKISFRDEVVAESFTGSSTEEEEEAVKKEVVRKETTPEIKKNDFAKKTEKPAEAQSAIKGTDKKSDVKPPWAGLDNKAPEKRPDFEFKTEPKKDDSTKGRPATDPNHTKKEEKPAEPKTSDKTSEKKVLEKEEEKKPDLDVVDSNLIMGAEDLPYLGDEDFEDEPLDESLLDDIDIDSIEEIEAPAEELPPDDLFGSEETEPEKKKAPAPSPKVCAKRATIYAIGRGGEESGPGTYSYMIEPDRGKPVKNTGNVKDTVSNKIQLTSIIEALKVLEGCENLKIYSDSKYVIFPFIKGWVYKWQANKWIKDSGSPVKDSDLWEELCALTKGINIQWEFVQNVSSVPQLAEICSKIGR